MKHASLLFCVAFPAQLNAQRPAAGDAMPLPVLRCALNALACSRPNRLLDNVTKIVLPVSKPAVSTLRAHEPLCCHSPVICHMPSHVANALMTGVSEGKEERGRAAKATRTIVHSCPPVNVATAAA
jgi:hypothetical protein